MPEDEIEAQWNQMESSYYFSIMIQLTALAGLSH